jgi:hypothetical protein
VGEADPKENTMLALMWNLSAALTGYLRHYMPANRTVDWLRTPPGLKWAIPVALVATLTYLFAMSICATTVKQGGPGCLNVLVLLFAWNAFKFAMMAVLTPLLRIARYLDVGAEHGGVLARERSSAPACCWPAAGSGRSS